MRVAKSYTFANWGVSLIHSASDYCRLLGAWFYWYKYPPRPGARVSPRPPVWVLAVEVSQCDGQHDQQQRSSCQHWSHSSASVKVRLLGGWFTRNSRAYKARLTFLEVRLLWVRAIVLMTLATLRPSSI